MAVAGPSRSGSYDLWIDNENSLLPIHSNRKTEIKPSTRLPSVKQSLSDVPKGSFIDVPIVGTNLPAANFLFNFSAETTRLPRRDLPELDDDVFEETYSSMRRPSYLDSHDEEPLLNPDELFTIIWPELDIPCSDFSDASLMALKRDIKKANSGITVQFVGDLNETAVVVAKKNVKLDTEAENLKIRNQWMDLRKKLMKAFDWNLEELERFENRVKERNRFFGMEKYLEARKNPVDQMQEISSIFQVPLIQVKQLDFVDEGVWRSLRSSLGNSSWPDMCKFFAFTFWKKKDVQKCAYYLSESHGSFWKADTIDKHNIYMSRVEEASYQYISANQVNGIETLKQEVHTAQNKALVEFGNCYSNFQKQLMKSIHSGWNVIQITTDADCSNRFGKDPRDLKGIPGIWITCFNTLPSGEVRSTVHYVPKQYKNTWEETFTKLIVDNKRVSEGFTEDRKTYWQIRAHHNAKLRDFLVNIERWIAPYAFLFPGNAKSVDIRAEIWRCVEKIEKLCRKSLSDSMSILFYKLIENIRVFPLDKVDLLAFLRISLAVSLEVAIKVNEFMQKLRAKAPEVIERHETILILDAELERYPFDWLPVFQKTATPVNRMFSLAHIYSTVQITAQFISNYPKHIRPAKGIFIVNPDKSLDSVQQRLEGYLSARKWQGICGKNPTNQQFENGLQKNDVMVYCGHGSGTSMYPEWAIAKLLCRSTPILMGCSSVQTKFVSPKMYHSVAIHSYFSAACPSVVGFLWEVTDIECDRVTIDLLERWLPCPEGVPLIPNIPNFDPTKERQKEYSLSQAVMNCRRAATQFMTEAAIVVYGLPVYTVKESSGKIICNN